MNRLISIFEVHVLQMFCFAARHKVRLLSTIVLLTLTGVTFSDYLHTTTIAQFLRIDVKTRVERVVAGRIFVGLAFVAMHFRLCLQRVAHIRQELSDSNATCNMLTQTFVFTMYRT